MREEKKLLLDEVTGQMNHFGSFVIMSYVGIPANKVNEFRTDVAKMGGNVEMVRKRLLVKAAEAAGVQIDLSALPGHIGLVFAKDDPIAMTKFVVEFGKSNDKAMEVVGGRFEGKLYNGADMEKIAELPSKDEMRAQFLSVLEAPMSQTLAVMEALLTSVIYCVDNKVKQDSEK